MNRRVLKMLLPVLVVVAGGFGAVATVATSEAKEAEPVFTKPVDSPRTVAPLPTGGTGPVDTGGDIENEPTAPPTSTAPPAPQEPPASTEPTRKPKPTPKSSGGGGCPDCLEDPWVVEP